MHPRDVARPRVVTLARPAGAVTGSRVGAQRIAGHVARGVAVGHRQSPPHHLAAVRHPPHRRADMQVTSALPLAKTDAAATSTVPSAADRQAGAGAGRATGHSAACRQRVIGGLRCGATEQRTLLIGQKWSRAGGRRYRSGGIGRPNNVSPATSAQSIRMRPVFGCDVCVPAGVRVELQAGADD